MEDEQAGADLDLGVRPEWTVTELRSILSEQREKPSGSELKGLSSLKLDQLIQKCKDLNIKIPEKPTRGLLMRMIREGAPATDTDIVPFGRYRGYRFSEVPMSWAIHECHNNENHSPDLASSKPNVGYRDPEETAKKAPPPAELPPKSALPKAEGGPAVKPKSKTAPRKKGRATTSDEDEDFTMVSEAGDNREKILELEKTVLELKAQIDAAKHATSSGNKCERACGGEEAEASGKGRGGHYELSRDCGDERGQDRG